MDIYAEEVMDHYENPRNQGELTGDDVQSARDSNASCGDMIQMYFRVIDGKITEVKWKGIGCAISTAASSKLSEYLIGKPFATIQKMSEEELTDKIGFTINPGRMKCLTLSVRVVGKLITSTKS